MDEESRNGIRHYQDLLGQFREHDAQAHADEDAAAAQPSASDDQLAGAAGAEAPQSNVDSDSPSHLHQDPRLRDIMETLYNEDSFLRGAAAAEPPPHDDGVSLDHQDVIRFTEMWDQGLHEEAYDFLTQLGFEQDELEQFREFMEYVPELAEEEDDYDDDVLELMYDAVAGGSLLAQMVRTALATLQGESYGGGFHGVPASPAAVASLEKQKFKDYLLGDEEHSECPICLKDYEAEDELSVMPCTYGHRYHQGCLAKWLERNHSCPLCRHALPTMDQREHSY